MLRLVPPIPSEPPDGYVAFVARHLAPLRDDATRVVGDRRLADELYPEVLTDVATRWGWLELQRRRLRQTGAADRYLDRAFARHSQQWQPEEQDAEFDFQVWSSERERAGAGDPVRRPTSVALRLAPVLRPAAETEFTPLLEATVAWAHACEVRRRRRLVLWGMAFLLLGLLLLRSHQSYDPSAAAALWPAVTVGVPADRWVGSAAVAS